MKNICLLIHLPASSKRISVKPNVYKEEISLSESLSAELTELR